MEGQLHEKTVPPAAGALAAVDIDGPCDRVFDFAFTLVPAAMPGLMPVVAARAGPVLFTAVFKVDNVRQGTRSASRRAFAALDWSTRDPRPSRPWPACSACQPSPKDCRAASRRFWSG